MRWVLPSRSGLEGRYGKGLEQGGKRSREEGQGGRIDSGTGGLVAGRVRESCERELSPTFSSAVPNGETRDEAPLPVFSSSARSSRLLLFVHPPPYT